MFKANGYEVDYKKIHTQLGASISNERKPERWKVINLVNIEFKLVN